MLAARVGPRRGRAGGRTRNFPLRSHPPRESRNGVPQLANVNALTAPRGARGWHAPNRNRAWPGARLHDGSARERRVRQPIRLVRPVFIVLAVDSVQKTSICCTATCRENSFVVRVARLVRTCPRGKVSRASTTCDGHPRLAAVKRARGAEKRPRLGPRNRLPSAQADAAVDSRACRAPARLARVRAVRS